MSAAPVKIRIVQKTDLAEITEIYAEAVETSNASWEWSPPPVTEMRRRCDALLEEGYPYLVAEIASVVVGFAYAGRFRARAAYQWTVENSVYVMPDMGGRGIGYGLLKTLIDECTSRNFRQMVAVIASSDNMISVKLHEKLGFREVGKLPGLGWKNQAWHDWILMARALGDGNNTPPEGTGAK